MRFFSEDYCEIISTFHPPVPASIRSNPTRPVLVKLSHGRTFSCPQLSPPPSWMAAFLTETKLFSLAQRETTNSPALSRNVCLNVFLFISLFFFFNAPSHTPPLPSPVCVFNKWLTGYRAVGEWHLLGGALTGRGVRGERSSVGRVRRFSLSPGGWMESRRGGSEGHKGSKMRVWYRVETTQSPLAVCPRCLPRH